MDLFLKNKLKELIPDAIYIRYEYWKLNRRFYSKKKIRTFSDRIFSWKLSQQLAQFSIFVDKYKVRLFVAEQCGEQYLPALFKVCRIADDFDLAEMPDKFVLKLNNGSGQNLIIKDKSQHSNSEIRKLITQWLQSDYYAMSKEKQYKNVEQLVICEECIESEGSLKDYKFYCIEGEIEFIQVIADKKNNKGVHSYYSKSWEPFPISIVGSASLETMPRQKKFEPKPEKLEEAVALAKKLSRSFSFVRVDLYIQDKVYFGELTFTPGNGYMKYLPEAYDHALSSRMRLGIKGDNSNSKIESL